MWVPSPPQANCAPHPNVDLSSLPPFPAFSVLALLNTPPSSLLLASSGKEYARPASFRSPGEVAKARKEAMGRLGLDFLGMGDEADTEMDWDKELADGTDGETLSVADTKTEPIDVEIRDAEHDVKAIGLAHGAMQVEPMVNASSSARHHDFKLEDSPVLSPNGRPMSAGSNTSFPPPSAFSSTYDPSAQPGPPALQDPPVELSARERNRLKRKRKAGTSAFVAGGTAPSGSSLNNTNGAGPSGPPPPPKGVSSQYSTIAAGEGGSSK